MDLEEQTKFAKDIENLLTKHLKGKEFHAIIAAEEEGDGFAFSISTLKRGSTFQSCELIVNGTAEEAKVLSDKFKIPSGTKLKKPIEPK